MENSSMVPQIFEHKKFGNIRIVVVNGKVWFVAADVCRALDLQNVTMALAGLKPQEKAKFNLGLFGGETNCVNEPGLYRLIFRSRKPEAEEFQDVVFYEILPSIRKTGNYISNPAAIGRTFQILYRSFLLLQCKLLQFVSVNVIDIGGIEERRANGAKN